MRVKKPSVYYLVLFFLIVLDLNFLDLVDTARLNILGIYYSDIVFVVCGCVVLLQLIHTKFKLRMGKMIFIILFFLTIAVLSAYSAHFSYNQSLLAGLAAQREWLSWVIMIFPLYSWLKAGKITNKGIATCIRCVCRCYAFVCIAQYFLYDHIKFTYTLTNSRYGDVRLYFNTAFFSYAICIIFDELFNRKISIRKKTRDIIEIAAYFFVVAIVTKGRMATLALVGSMTIFLCLRKNISLLKKAAIIGCVIVGVIAFTYTTMGQDIINTFMGTSTANNTLGVRDAAKAYYVAKTLTSFQTTVLGYGVPNIHSQTAMAITNPLWANMGDARFYLNDVGITGIFFEYGILGVLLLIGITVLAAVEAARIYKKHNKGAYLQFIVLDVITWASLTPTVFDTSIMGTIIICSVFWESKLNAKKDNSFLERRIIKC